MNGPYQGPSVATLNSRARRAAFFQLMNHHSRSPMYPGIHMSYGLNSFKGVMWGTIQMTILGAIKGDTGTM